MDGAEIMITMIVGCHAMYGRVIMVESINQRGVVNPTIQFIIRCHDHQSCHEYHVERKKKTKAKSKKAPGCIIVVKIVKTQAVKHIQSRNRYMAQ